MIGNGVIFIWSDTNATIPSGWERVTALDGRFPKCTTDGVDPAVNGGAATHTHTSPSHTHTMSDHTHTTIINMATGGGTTTYSDSGAAKASHAHANIYSGSASSTSASSVEVTYGSLSNNPPYYEVIFITPTSDSDGLPTNVIGFSDDTAFSANTGKYVGYYPCDGTNSTTNLSGKYLRGAATGGDSGTTGGSTTNAHSIDHGHTQSHTHSNATSGVSTAEQFSGEYDPGKTDVVLQSHTHTLSYSTNTDEVASSAISITCDETIEPLYKKLLAIQNKSATTYAPIGIIGMWLGTVAAVPTNFELVTAMYSYYAKVTVTAADAGSTGGANTHTHAAKGHTHTLSHTHTASVSGHVQVWDNTGSGYTAATSGTVHTATVSSASLTLASADTTAASSSNEPLYTTVAFIKLLATDAIASESVSVTDNVHATLADNSAVSESVAVTDYVDVTIRAGNDLNISIWKEHISVVDTPLFPGPFDSYGNQEGVSVQEKVTVKITDVSDVGHKPSFIVTN